MGRPLDMPETLAVDEPPAKKLCRDALDHHPFDPPELAADDDDDFYDTPPIKPSSVPFVPEPASSSTPSAPVAIPGIPSLEIPGLGLLAATSPTEALTTKISDAIPSRDVASSTLLSSASTPPRTDEQVAEANADFLRAGEENKGDENAEWQLDSSGSDSSSDTSSDDSSDDSSEDEGLLMGPEEQARILMQAEIDGETGPTEGAQIRSANEMEEKFEKPNITVTPDMKITELGRIESIVENMVLIKASVSGDYRVLEATSPLCLADRTVIGQVSETLGRVQEPRYSLGFNDAAEVASLGLEKGTRVYYVDDHAKFVFTEPLKAQKFTDASNLHDEEADDSEFSDDEKEAEYKRKKKQEKKAKTGQALAVNDAPPPLQAGQYQSGGLNYSDDDEDLGMYKPLARPDHFEDIVGNGAPLEDRSHVRRGNPRPPRAWPRGGRGGGGARGDRGRGRGDRVGGRGDRGGGRGDRGGARGDRGGARGDRGNRFSRGGQHQEHNRHDNRHKHSSPKAKRSPKPSASPAQRRHDPPEQPRTAAPPAPPAQNSTMPTTANVQASSWNQSIWPFATTANTQTAPNQYASAAPSYTTSNPSPAPALPAGAFINPSFQPYQTSTTPQDQQQAAAQAQLLAWAQWFQSVNQAQNNSTASSGAQSNDAYQAAQQNLDILRSLNNKGPGS